MNRAEVRSSFVEQGRERTVHQVRDPDRLIALAPFGPIVVRSHLDDGHADPQLVDGPTATCRLDFDARIASFETSTPDGALWLDHLRYHHPLWQAIGWSLRYGSEPLDGQVTGEWRSLPRPMEAYQEPLCPLLRAALAGRQLGIGWRGREPVLVGAGRLTPPHAVRQAVLRAAHEGRLTLPELVLTPIDHSVRVAQPPLVLPTGPFAQALDPRHPIDGLVRFVAALRTALEHVEEAEIGLAPGQLTMKGVPEELVWPAVRGALGQIGADADALVALLEA